MTVSGPDLNAYVFEALGSIKAQLNGLTALAHQQAQAARDAGEDTADRLDTLTRQFTGLQAQVAEVERNYTSLRASMNVLEPKVETLVTQRNRVLSMVAAIMAVGSAAWWVFGAAIMEMARALLRAFKV